MESDLTRPARWPSVANLVLLTATVAAISVFAEVALRAGYHVRHRRSAPVHVNMRGSSDAYDDSSDYYGKHATNPTIDYSTYLGYVSRAGVSGAGYRTNVHHARYDEDFPVRKPRGEMRVFVTGGSTAWGQGVSQGQTFAARAELRFRAEQPGRKVRVVSTGVTAYGSVQERIMVENLLLPLGPDWIVMFSGWNDSYFGYSGKDILREQDFMKYRDVLAQRRPGVAPPPGQPAIYPPEYEEYASKLLYFIDVRLFSLRYPNLEVLTRAVRRQSLPPERVVETLEGNLEILADLGRRQGFRLLFYLQPSIYSTAKTLSRREASLVEAARSLYAGFGGYNQTVYAAYRSRLPELARSRCFVFVDGDAAIRDETGSVFVDHAHFGSRGNRLIGEHLHETLSRLEAESTVAAGCAAF